MADGYIGRWYMAATDCTPMFIWPTSVMSLTGWDWRSIRPHIRHVRAKAGYIIRCGVCQPVGTLSFILQGMISCLRRDRAKCWITLCGWSAEHKYQTWHYLWSRRTHADWCRRVCQNTASEIDKIALLSVNIRRLDLRRCVQWAMACYRLSLDDIELIVTEQDDTGSAPIIM